MFVNGAGSFHDTDGNFSANDDHGIQLIDIAGNVTLIRTTLEDNDANGDTTGDGLNATANLNADAIGGNCGNGPDELVPVIARMRAVAPDVVLVAKSNVGIPRLVGTRAVYEAEPAEMADQARAMGAAGATIVGACCGSTPEHVRAMADALRPSEVGPSEVGPG